ncbi:MAG: T9SS type A sorting domain-containing protein [Bacteroidetes bacterium]|jgi:hypothetical protein|nr:T9SS type A sorting domain-containing protein [Bacteroidota bacterium]
MKQVFTLIVLFCAISMGHSQDIGIERLIYPTKPFMVYELSTRIPVFWQIKNYGDTIDSRVVTLGLYPEGSSPGFSLFRSDFSKGQSVPIDYRNPEFYNFGLNNLVDIDFVMGFTTPEHAAGDTIEICLQATVTGDTNPDNDTLCFKIILADRQERDLALHILNPVQNAKTMAGATVEFEISVRNDGATAYTADSLYLEMAIIKDDKLLDAFNFGVSNPSAIPMGDSASVSVDIPLSYLFPEGDVIFGFQISWLSDDGLVELGETSHSNNTRYVVLEVTPSGIGELGHTGFWMGNAPGTLSLNSPTMPNGELDVQLFTMGGQLVKRLGHVPMQGGTAMVDTKGLPLGTYIISVSQGSQFIYRSKVVVE